MDILESCERKEKKKRRAQIQDIFLLAEVQTRYLVRPENTDIPRPWEYYPELFKPDRIAFEAKKAEDELEACKISRRQYAQEFNIRRQQGV